MKIAARVIEWIGAVLVLAALAGITWLLVSTIAHRITYPFDLEWMEGGMLVHALRVQQGLPLFIPPCPEFIPYIYPPLYAWVLAGAAHFVGVSYTLGRGVTVAGIAISTLLLIWALRRESGTWLPGLAAAALFLSCYDDAGAFYDLVRTDGLLLALGTGALVAARKATPRAVALAGILLALAFLTKHNTAVMGLPIAIFLWRNRGWRRAAWFSAWAAGPALLATLVLTITTQGNFLVYLLEVPASHPIVATRLWPGSEKELAMAFPWALGFAALIGLLHIRQWGEGAKYWMGVFGVGILVCIIMRGHHGGFLNVLIPGYWLEAFMVGMALATVMKRLRARRWPKALGILAMGALVAWQTWEGRWVPKRYLPTDKDLAAGELVLDVIRSFDGPVLMPSSPWYPVLAGKDPSFHLIALWDVTHERSPYTAEVRSINRALARHRFAAVILSSADFGQDLQKYYVKTDTIHLAPGALAPRTGWRARPTLVFTPRENTGKASDPPVDATTPSPRSQEEPIPRDDP